MITGLTKDDFDRMLVGKAMHYTHFYSITDDLWLSKEFTQDIHNRPRFDEYEWNTAKAVYCKNNLIDVMIDDTEKYGKYFETPFFLFQRVS